MAGKRQATTNLNHDNWDQEDEPEERGTFRTAPPEELKARVIKKATRRKAATGTAGDDDADSPGKSVFSGFSGFGKPTAAATGSTPFAFLSNLPASTATSNESSPKPSGSGNSSSIFKDAASLKPPAKPFSIDANSKTDLTSNSQPSSSGGSSAARLPAPAASTSIFGNATAAMSPKAPVVSMFKSSVSAENTTASSTLTTSSEYRDSMGELNMAVMKFLQEHMDKNPYCILTPVFDSYEKYMKELREKNEAKTGVSSKSLSSETSVTTNPTETETPTTSTPLTTTTTTATTTTTISASDFLFHKPISSTDTASPSTPFGKKPNCTVTSGSSTSTVTAPFFSFGSVEKPAATSPTKSEATSSTAAPASIFSFGVKSASSSTAESNKEKESPKPGFFFGGQDGAGSSSTSLKTNGFSFGLTPVDDKPTSTAFMGFGKPAGEAQMPPPSGFGSPSWSPFSFANVKPPSAAEIANAEEEEEDKPPVVEFKQVVEDDATFSKRCKVFVKKDKDFTDRGVGTLYLKPVKDTKKTQMLVRADTNLGNILVNLILADGLPVQRMGKNNVMMVCIPTPEETKAMSILLRVKTAEEADELLEQIKKHTV